ncbi:MAG: hypothetical protein ABI347_05330 [Nitrososphaera sp.]
MRKTHAVVFAVLLPLLLLLMMMVQPAAADPLTNAMKKERIGNYNFEIALQPNPPVSGAVSQIMLRVSSVNGDDLVDLPVTIRIEKNGHEVTRAGPLVIPFGHYTYPYTFLQPGRYVLYADVKDYAYSGDTLTFTFIFNVAGPNDYLYVLVPGVGAAGAGAAGAVMIMKRRRKA